MPQNTTLPVTTQWELITDTNVTEVTFQAIGVTPVLILGTNGTTRPDADAYGIAYRPGEGEAKRTLADLFPGVSGVNRLWARTEVGSGRVFVSHA